MTTQSICEKSDNLSKRGSMSIGFSWKKITKTLKTTNKIIEDEWNTALVTKHFRKSTKLLSRCALCNLSFLFIKHKPIVHLEENNYDILAAPPPPPPISSFPLSSSNVADGAQGGNRKMSFAYLSHVSLILKTKKIVKLLGKTIGGGLKKCFADCAGQGKEGEPKSIYPQKRQFHHFWGHFHGKSEFVSEIFAFVQGTGTLSKWKDPKEIFDP